MLLLAWYSLSAYLNSVLFSVFDLCINLKHSKEEFLKIFQESFFEYYFPQLKDFITILRKLYKFIHYLSMGNWPAGKALVQIVA